MKNPMTMPTTVRTKCGDGRVTRARSARHVIGALGVDEAMYPTDGHSIGDRTPGLHHEADGALSPADFCHHNNGDH